MIPRSIRGRLVAAFVALALAVLLAVGGSLFLVLRGLHADATFGGLSDVAGSVLPQVRGSLGNGELRGTIEEIRDQLAASSISVFIVTADGRLRAIGAGGGVVGTLTLEGSPAVGESVRGTVDVGGTRYLYVATILRRVAAAAPKALAFLAPDRSGTLAVADVLRAIPIVVLAMLAVGVPLAWVLARSVSRPLARIAAATAVVPAGHAEPLPLEGPSEVRELTTTFNAMAAELQATRERESQLLANLRHDLRTPLTVISGFAAALRDGTAQGEAASAAARAIEEESERLERMLRELAAIERIRSGEDRLRPELLDAREVAQRAVARFAGRADAAHVALSLAGEAASPVPLAADRLALDRMLGNLIENALRAVDGSPGGHVAIELAEERLHSDAEAVRIDVVDDGPGFPEGAAGRAFERFWRADPSRSGAGSGLGLSIVRELAEAHGGSVHAENVVPHGARVGVTLPRVAWPRLERP